MPFFRNFKNINLNAQDKYASTALITATLVGHTDVVKTILHASNHNVFEEKIDINLKDEEHCTALMCAVINNRLEIVEELLVQDNIDVNSLDKKSIPP